MTDVRKVQAALDKVRDRFLALLPARRAIVSKLLREVEQNRVQGVSLEQAREVLHQIAGTAQTLGFDALGVAARAGEDEIDAACATMTFRRALSDKLRSAIEQMSVALGQPAATQLTSEKL